MKNKVHCTIIKSLKEIDQEIDRFICIFEHTKTRASYENLACQIDESLSCFFCEIKKISLLLSKKPIPCKLFFDQICCIEISLLKANEDNGLLISEIIKDTDLEIVKCIASVVIRDLLQVQCCVRKLKCLLKGVECCG